MMLKVHFSHGGEGQGLHHDEGRERRASALGGAWAWGGEIDVLLQQLQHVDKLVGLGLAFLGGKQAFFDYGWSGKGGRWGYYLMERVFRSSP
ncbi:hypothetical protein MTYM_02198 [Methylococcales bacterium]|nr:hypothetical protein MTYM_02198 [Methylococcales bacterium]